MAISATLKTHKKVKSFPPQEATNQAGFHAKRKIKHINYFTVKIAIGLFSEK
jgi:hypothetical protein